jgi:twitching motility protein PilT
LPGQIEGAKRYLALEVLWNTSPIFSAIRNNKLESIDNYLLTGRDEGMVSFDESIRQLYREGKISQEIAESQVRDRAFITR